MSVFPVVLLEFMDIKDAPIFRFQISAYQLPQIAIVSQLGITLSLNWLPKSPPCLAIFLLPFFLYFLAIFHLGFWVAILFDFIFVHFQGLSFVWGSGKNPQAGAGKIL